MDVPKPESSGNQLVLSAVSAASRAAMNLADFPAATGIPPLRTETVRFLAREMGSRLSYISKTSPTDTPRELLAEAARTCGDLATLTACNAGVFAPEAATGEVLTAASDAARTIHDSLVPVLERDDSSHSAFLARDIRGAVWKASIAGESTG